MARWVQNLPLESLPIPSETERESLKKDHKEDQRQNVRQGCFHPASLVEVKDLGLVLMRDLRPGQRVLTKKGWSKVITFLHWHRSESVGAILIDHERGSLTLTPNHLVLTCDENGRDGGYKAAGSIYPGMFLLAADRKPAPVLSTSQTSMSGYYSPLTENGSIIVDGVVASCYMQDEKFRMPHWAMHALTKTAYFIDPDEMEEVPGEGRLHTILGGESRVDVYIINTGEDPVMAKASLYDVDGQYLAPIGHGDNPRRVFELLAQ